MKLLVLLVVPEKRLFEPFYWTLLAKRYANNFLATKKICPPL